jgi:hypothetical protein
MRSPDAAARQAQSRQGRDFRRIGGAQETVADPTRPAQVLERVVALEPAPVHLVERHGTAEVIAAGPAIAQAPLDRAQLVQKLALLDPGASGAAPPGDRPLEPLAGRRLVSQVVGQLPQPFEGEGGEGVVRPLAHGDGARPLEGDAGPFPVAGQPADLPSRASFLARSRLSGAIASTRRTASSQAATAAA